MDTECYNGMFVAIVYQMMF